MSTLPKLLAELRRVPRNRAQAEWKSEYSQGQMLPMPRVNIFHCEIVLLDAEEDTLLNTMLILRSLP